MSVCLVKVKGPDGDGGGSDGVEVTLPLVLGRGSLLKCGDKKVSRRHAYLDWEDTGVLITAVHQSPTYVVVGDEEVQEVTEGSSVLLTHGDKFGLLRDKFWYMVQLSSLVLAEEKKPVTPSRKEGEEERSENEDVNKEEGNGESEEEETKPETGESTKSIQLNGEAKGKEEEGDKKEEKEEEANITGDTKEATERIKLNGNTEETTRSLEDTTEEETHHAKKDEPKDERREQERIEDDEGRTEKHSDSLPPSPSSSIVPSTTSHSTTSSPKTIIQKELSSGINKRERKLPSWLQNSKGGIPTPSTPYQPTPRTNKRQAGAKTSPSRKTVNTPPTTTTTTTTTTSAPPKFQSDENLFNLERVSKRREQDPQKPQKTTKSPLQDQPTTAKEEGGGGGGGVHHQVSDNDDDAVTTTTAASPPSSPIPHPAKKSKEDREEKEEEGSSTTTPKRAFPTPSPTTGNAPRPSCQYGTDCYRKNPTHREEEAHPGDTDYRAPGDDNDSDDDRPQCEYGVECYRKNPQHRRDFKHSRIPQPQRRAKRKARQQKGRKGTGKDSDEDDYDFDDPFLNDGSSDDYAPTDDTSDSAMDLSQGAEEEDTKRMMKEAKKFVKRRK